MSGRALKGKPRYAAWVRDLGGRYRRSKAKAAAPVTHELLTFYWSLGRGIVETQAENTYGSGFYVALSRDLRKEIQMPRDSRREISGT